MPEELPPSLFKILREDLATTRSEINQRLDSIAAQSVSQSTFDQVQRNQKERDDRQDARIRELEGKEDDRTAELRKVIEEQRKTKAQTLTTLGFALLGLVLTIIGGITVWTLQNTLSQLVGAGGS